MQIREFQGIFPWILDPKIRLFHLARQVNPHSMAAVKQLQDMQGFRSKTKIPFKKLSSWVALAKPWF